MSAAGPQRITLEPARHVLSFSDHLLPIGYGRCVQCNKVMNAKTMVSTPCPGRKP